MRYVIHMTTKTFNADLARLEDSFRKADAIRTTNDGFTYIDQSRVSASLVGSYQRLMQFGYANGLI